MATLNYLPSFEEDATELWCYVAQDDPAAADRLVDRIYERCQILTDHPLAGQARPDIGLTCRQLVVGPVLILYQYEAGQVDLVRALHSRRQISPDMFSDVL